MSGSSVLLDSNVIILASKGQIDVVSLVSQFDNFFVSIVTFMEVYGYQFEDEEEKKAVDALFSQLQIVEVNLPIAQKVVEYRSKPHKKIKIPDAIILATAFVTDSVLLTGDWDDFRGFDSAVKVSDLNIYKI